MKWDRKIYVGDIFHNDDIPFELKRDSIVKRLRSMVRPRKDEDFVCLIEDLEVTEDEDEFDDVWNDIYDWADENRVWIETWERAAV